MTLQCSQCGNYIAEPFDAVDGCNCGGVFLDAEIPFGHFDTGCLYCDHLALAIHTGVCMRAVEQGPQYCAERTREVR